jgi:hypothetical protein
MGAPVRWSFAGELSGRLSRTDAGVLNKLLESDAEQEMADHLGLKWHERAGAAERVDYGNGYYPRDYVTPLG